MTDRYAALPAEVYHLVDAQNWPAIQREGLHSTTTLIARADLTGAGSAPFATWRATGMDLPGSGHIRDQSPMPPDALARCLDPGLTPQDWYDLLNAKVFFWLDRDRLDRHIAACRARPQVLLTLDLPRLLDRHGERAFLTPFNVGNARRAAAARSTHLRTARGLAADPLGKREPQTIAQPPTGRIGDRRRGAGCDGVCQRLSTPRLRPPYNTR